MKERLKNHNGITLVALVITIIVLLILAMVSIKLVWNGGIIAHAQNAVNAYNEAQTNELQKLNEIDEQMGEIGKAPWYRLTDVEKEELKPYLMVNEEEKQTYGYMIAGTDESNYQIILYIEESPVGEEICIGVPDGTVYVYPVSDKTGTFKQFNKKWCYGNIDNGYTEYTGNCPIKVENFNTINCQSYVDRIIQSFNK